MQSDEQKVDFHFFQAWKLWMEDKPIKLVDELVGDLCNISDVLRYIHVGLLCVQQRPEDRPNMSTVVQMLSSESKSAAVVRSRQKQGVFCLPLIY
jgi:hypothetical protein